MLNMIVTPAAYFAITASDIGLWVVAVVIVGVIVMRRKSRKAKS